MVDELIAHENGVTCLTFANGDLYTGSYDHYIFAWDLVEIEKRIIERDMMVYEDIKSWKIEVKLCGDYWIMIKFFGLFKKNCKSEIHEIADQINKKS